MKEVDLTEWDACQKYERLAWGNMIYITPDNGEVIKQNTYAKEMGITDTTEFDNIDLNGKSVIDIGAGPISLLLRSVNFSAATGIEPLFYSDEVDQLYKAHGVELKRIPAEDIDETVIYDEVWMYNCLQHTMSPAKILNKIKTLGKRIRIFEWLDIPEHEGHPQEMKIEHFVDILNLKESDYRIVDLNTRELVGRAIVINKEQ
jgi:hypothetical protein